MINLFEKFFFKKLITKYYNLGYNDGQQLINDTLLEKDAYKTFIELLNHCGIRFTYNKSKGGLIISTSRNKLNNLKKLIECYENKKF